MKITKRLKGHFILNAMPLTSRDLFIAFQLNDLVDFI